jgi:DnaJ family protein A protein 2
MPSYRHHDFGNLYIQFDVKFPQRLGGPDGASITPEQIAALESVLAPRVADQLPPPDVMTDDFQLEDVDPTREQARSRGMNPMDDEDDEMHGGGERVQCASQ